MIARRNRLAREDFPILLKSGKRAVSEHFSITYSKKTKGCAVVVGKKIIKTSVGRHKIKRRVQYVLNMSEINYSYVIFAKKGANLLSFMDLKKEISTLLDNIGV